MDLITSGETARLLRVDPRTLRKYETSDGKWCVVFGYRYRFRVFHYGGGLRPTRRYDRHEVLRVLRELERAN